MIVFAESDLPNALHAAYYMSRWVVVAVIHGQAEPWFVTRIRDGIELHSAMKDATVFYRDIDAANYADQCKELYLDYDFYPLAFPAFVLGANGLKAIRR